MTLAILNPGESLTVVMSGAAATTNPKYAALWRTGFGEFNQPVGSLAGATAVTVVAAPVEGQRTVEALDIFNADTAAVTVTISKVISGTSYTLRQLVLASGSSVHVDRLGSQVLSASVVAGIGAANGSTVSASEQGNGVVQKTVITMTDTPVTVGNTTGVSFGGVKIYDFPEGRLLVLGATLKSVAFGLTHAGNLTPIDATMGGDVSVGTTVAGDGTLTGADVDLIPSTSIDPISGGVAGSPLAASAQFDGTATAKDAFFNILIDDADVANAASDVLLVSAVLTIHWINLGDY